MIMSISRDDAGTPAPPSIRTVAVASFAGSAVEYYDFFIYATAAALIFPRVFFSGVDPFLGTLASFGTFAAGFLARPLGAAVFGHFGDRVGRKNVLVVSLIMMGLATVVIGVLPGYATLGVWAPILLVALRLVQGFAFGGEWGGAFLLAYEFAPWERRTFFASLPATGPVLGVVLGNAAFLAVGTLPDEALLAWGWRLPFLASLLLVVIGVVVRRRIAETPAFVELRHESSVARVPLWDSLRTHPRQLVLVAGAFVGFGLFTAIVATYMVSYATSTVGVSRPSILLLILVATGLQLITIPAAAMLADRHGATGPVVIGGCLTAAGVFLLFALVDTGSFGLMLLGYLLVLTGAFSLAYGALFATMVEAFDTRVRYSALSLSGQVANLLGSAFGPAVGTLLLQATGSSMAVAAYVAAALLVSVACFVALARTNRRRTGRGAATAGGGRPNVPAPSAAAEGRNRP